MKEKRTESQSLLSQGYHFYHSDATKRTNLEQLGRNPFWVRVIISTLNDRLEIARIEIQSQSLLSQGYHFYFKKYWQYNFNMIWVAIPFESGLSFLQNNRIQRWKWMVRSQSLLSQGYHFYLLKQRKRAIYNKGRNPFWVRVIISTDESCEVAVNIETGRNPFWVRVIIST